MYTAKVRIVPSRSCLPAQDIKVSACPSGVPAFLEFPAELTASECDDGVRFACRLEHTRLFEPADNGFCSQLRSPQIQGRPLLAKFPIAYRLLIPFEMVLFDLEDLRSMLHVAASR
jgi:hypothetical protein